MDRQHGLPNMINQLTAYGRIGAKNESESFKKHGQRST